MSSRNRMGKCFTILLMCVHFISVAQASEELKKRCSDMSKFLTQKRNYHLQYKVQIKGKDAYMNVEDQMLINLYRKGDLKYVKMGEAAEIIQEDDQVLMVNHVGKFLQLGMDTSKVPQNPIQELNGYLSESISTTVKKDKGLITYILGFPENHMHERIELAFDSKTQVLVSTYSVFSKDYQEPYHSVRVSYLLWDDSVIPSSTVPSISKYLTRSGKTFKQQPAWETYKFHQAEKGKLKL